MLLQIISNLKIEKILLCSKVIFKTLSTYNKGNLLLLASIPFVSSYLNLHVQKTLNLSKEKDNILYCLICKGFYDYLSFIVQSNLLHKQCRKIYDNLILRLNMSKIHCGVSIPGHNQKQFKDLLDDSYKLRDFLFVLPMMWFSIISFGTSIFNMNIESNYPIRLLFSIFCISMCILLTYISDTSLYEKTKPNSKSITKFNDANYVKMKISMGCHMDTEFEINKKIKMDKQHNIQKYVICFVNLIVTYISLSNKDISHLQAFSNISWMLGCLSDNLKSFKYYVFVNDFLSLCETLEKHKLETKENFKGKSKTKSDFKIIKKVDFVNASFGYYCNNLSLQPEPKYDIKIFNFTYSFKCGIFYYLEAPNGIGKSTLLRMFSSNLLSGNVFFGSQNRKDLSFEYISSIIFHIVQASEYTPKFTTEEVKAYKGLNFWLQKQLGLENLLNKDTIEMSGGQKKRIFIYMVLTSSAPILLLDEILSELSTEETPEVPEGGGWLKRVITTLINWKGRENKIMILVGHGLIDLINSIDFTSTFTSTSTSITKKKGKIINRNIVKLKLENIKNKTFLITRD